MSEIVENVNEQNSAHSQKASALSTEAVDNVTTNSVEAAAKAVPEAATNENADNTATIQDAEKSSDSPKVDGKKTPAKRTPPKRRSFIERAQRESEELVKNMGGSLEIEGGRRTRSSTRGTPNKNAAASTPPPAKKARTSPASGASTPTTRPRARGRKLDVADDTAEEVTPSEKKTPTKGKKAAAANDVEVEEEKPKEVTPEENKKLEEKDEEDIQPSDSNLVADISKEAAACSEDSKEITNEKVNEKPEDEADTTLEPVVEETESQVAADLLPTVTKSDDVPVEMVTEIVDSDNSVGNSEDVKYVENATENNKGKAEEATTVPLATLKETKEPTPEPMEIDSSSRSNDAISEAMDDDVVEIIEEAEAAQAPIKIVEKQPPAAEITPSNVSTLNNVEKVVESIKENSLVVAPSTDIVDNNSIATKPAELNNIVTDNENNTEEGSLAANEVNKTANDLCEPKIATSPPISAPNDNTSVTTPQTCN